jgi:hypothetical protein
MKQRRRFQRRHVECAGMLIAAARVVLDAHPLDFAAWLRSVAGDIEAEARTLLARFQPKPVQKPN